MELALIPIGYGNTVVGQRIVAIIAPDSSPVKRLREEAAAHGKLIDATHGRKTRALIVMDSDHVILSALQPDTISQRFGDNETQEVTAPEARSRNKK
jgi:extracellular matrix regulatory protein A